MNIRPLEIRRPDLTELPELTILDRAIFGEHCYNAMTIRQFYDLAGSLLLVAAVGSELAGYALALPSASDGEGWFVALGVRPGHRRQAIGRTLAMAVLHEAKLADIASLRLTVERGNLIAQNLYKDLGFFPERDETNYFGPGEHRIVMRNSTI